MENLLFIIITSDKTDKLIIVNEFGAKTEIGVLGIIWDTEKIHDNFCYKAASSENFFSMKSYIICEQNQL